MRIQEIAEAVVIVRLNPADCLLLADACRAADLRYTEHSRHADAPTFRLASAHLEGLALIAAAQGLVVETEKFLADFTLAHVREQWAIVGDEGKEVSK